MTRACPRGHLYRGKRCPECVRVRLRSTYPQRRERDRVRWFRGYKAERAAIVASEPWCHNPDCPHTDVGSRRNPLTVEHLVRVTDGGLHGPKTVLCQRCNSSRGGRR